MCDALLALVVWRSLVATGANPGWVLAYLWSPLVSLEVARHGHLDVAGALLVALAAFALARGRALTSSIALALSVAVKLLPIVLLPLLWRRVSLRHVIAGLAVLLTLYLPFWDQRRLPIGSVPDVIDRFRFNGPIFSGVAFLAGPAGGDGIRGRRGSGDRCLGATPASRRGRHRRGQCRWRPRSSVLRSSIPGTSCGSRRSSSRDRRCRWRLDGLDSEHLRGVARVGLPWGPVWALLVEYGALLGSALWPWRGDARSLRLHPRVRPRQLDRHVGEGFGNGAPSAFPRCLVETRTGPAFL